MANTYPIVTGLTTYVDQHLFDLRYKANLGSRAAEVCTLQTGVKSQAAINILTTAVVSEDAKACAWSGTTQTTLSQRTLKVNNLKYEEEICLQKLLQYWAGYKVKVAMKDATAVPFEEQFIGDLLNKVSANIDKQIWSGNDSTSAGGGSATGSQVRGLVLSLLAGTTGTCTSPSSDAVAITTSSATTKWGKVQDLINAASADIYANGEPVRLYASPAFVRGLALEFVNQNLYHFEPGVDINEFQIPGTSIILTAVAGLATGLAVASKEYIILSPESNIVYGVDMEGDTEDFKLWYSEDNDTIRVRVKANAGLQFAFADLIKYMEV